jgi:AcrR family transcriptional regulator
MEEGKSKKAERSDATRAALLAAGRKFFGKKGYAEAATEDVVAAARVTRGALYYHFKDKAALFDAVVEDIAAEVLEKIEKAAASEDKLIDGLIAGCRAYLDACLAPSVRRIYVIDAPAVIGPQRMREIDARYALGSLAEGVDAILAENPSPALSADALTALLSGALDEAVLWLVHNDDAASRRRLDRTLDALIRRTIASSTPGKL